MGSRSTSCGSRPPRRSRPSTTPRSIFDRGAKAPLVMLSTKGGMDIEQVADEDPDAIARLHVDPLLGFQDFHGRRLAFEAGVDADVVRPVGELLAEALRGVHRRGGDAGRGQPPDRHAGADRQGARREGHARRQLAVPAPRQRRAARPLQGGPAGADGQGARPHLRQARRQHRHPRQRRRAVDVDARRRRRSRAARRRTSSTPAAARRRTRSPARSR